MWWNVGGVLAACWLYVRILIFSSADPLHDGEGKCEYCDILELLRGMVWRRKAARITVYFLCCVCVARFENVNKL